MNHPRPAPDPRSPRSLLRELRRRSARVETAVALALLLSTCTLLYAVAQGQAALS